MVGAWTAARARACCRRRRFRATGSSAAAQATDFRGFAGVRGLEDGHETSLVQKRGRSGKRELAGVDMHAAQLGAAAELRKHLAGIEQALGIEGAFQPLLLVEVGLVEHRVHEVALLDADAVLAGQHAADLDAKPEDVGAERLRALEFARLVGVVEDQRMQIAVAGVKHIGARAGRYRASICFMRAGRRPIRLRGIVPSMQ